MAIINTTKIDTEYGIFDVSYFEEDTNSCVLLSFGDITNGTPIVRLHSSCLFSETMHSLDCDCNLQLSNTMKLIADEGKGVVAYLYQEGRGHGLAKKIQSMDIERTEHIDTAEAFKTLGLELDPRDYTIAIHGLDALHTSKAIKVVSNNPRKSTFLENNGYTIIERIHLEYPINDFVQKYLKAKKQKLGHTILNTRIAVLGAINFDYTTFLEKLPEITKTHDVASIPKKQTIMIGGKGTNTAVGLSKLDNMVYMVGKVGNYIFGKEALRLVSQDKIQTNFVRVDSDVTTGSVQIAIDQDKNLTCCVYKGANHTIIESQILEFYDYIDDNQICLNMVYLTLELLPNIVELMIDEANKRSIPIFLDLSPKTSPLPVDYFSKVPFIICNKEEVAHFTRMKIESVSDAKEAALALRSKGAKTVIITMHEEGSILLEELSTLPVHFKAIRTKFVEHVGAGAAFKSGFITYYLCNENLQKAMKFGNACGSYAVTRIGSYDSLPTFEALATMKLV